MVDYCCTDGQFDIRRPVVSRSIFKHSISIKQEEKWDNSDFICARKGLSLYLINLEQIKYVVSATTPSCNLEIIF